MSERALLDLLPDAVIRLDAERRVVEGNASLEALTGYSLVEMRGKPLGDLLDPRGRDGKPIWVEGWDPATRLRSVVRIPEQEIEIRRADDKALRVNVTGAYERDSDGRLEGAVLVLRESARRAHVAAAGIEIVSTVSHELRSPLTSVKGYTSLLLNRWDRLKDEQKRMMLEQVHHDADRVTRLITELLDISRLETGRLVLRREMVDLAELVDRVLEKVGMEYPDLEAEVALPEECPRVYADPDKVQQVLTNLVENAVKYASPKGLRVRGEADGDAIAVSVVDVGEGIPPNDLHRIFTKFFRRAETRPTGSGLGLWISRGLVEAHGGQLTAASIPGKGSTFRFTLPLTTFEEFQG
ncbi:MAG: PAS domain-containing protein [Actinobacteria bacterium]|nr:MAG: PAS domain-containing protein [Actinomycetota bacterium]